MHVYVSSAVGKESLCLQIDTYLPAAAAAAARNPLCKKLHGSYTTELTVTHASKHYHQTRTCADLTNVDVGSVSKGLLRELGVIEQGVLPPVYVGAQRLLVSCDHSAVSE